MSLGALALAGQLVFTSPDPEVDLELVEHVWQHVRREAGAPADFPAPPITVDWEPPRNANMYFQYPTVFAPGTRMQIGVAPHTLTHLSSEKVVWALGHELAHYALLMQENHWDLTRPVFISTVLHHCDPWFKRVTRGVADVIWDIYHSDTDRGWMYNEVERVCASTPEQ